MNQNPKHDQKPKDKDAETGEQPTDDEVDEASQESFPASDAPGWSQETPAKPNPKKSPKGEEGHRGQR